MRVRVEHREAGNGLGVIGIRDHTAFEALADEREEIPTMSTPILIKLDHTLEGGESTGFLSIGLLGFVTEHHTERLREGAHDAICYVIAGGEDASRAKVSVITIPPEHPAGSLVYEHGLHVQEVAENCCAARQYELNVGGRRQRFVIDGRSAWQNCLRPEDEELREPAQTDYQLTDKPTIEVQEFGLLSFGFEFRHKDR